MHNYVVHLINGINRNIKSSNLKKKKLQDKFSLKFYLSSNVLNHCTIYFSAIKYILINSQSDLRNIGNQFYLKQ